MKNTALRALVLISALFTGHAMAQETVNFNLTATILPGVCRVSAANVDLGTYYATQFTGTGTTLGWVSVPITVNNCDPLITRVALRISGTADASSAAYFRGVTGIGIELQRETSLAAIVPAGTTVQYATANGTYTLRARLRQTAASVVAGNVSSPITVAMTYN
ncbi:fimbrial protein [Stenotrophomonas maltophilia]|uniref:fimbrial protein n=1 Tax=Stenotrophomonas maltophilia TaxID=40324 RepID=UPI0039C2C733